MRKLLASLLIGLLLLALSGVAWPKAADAASPVVVHVPLNITKVQTELANKLYLQLELSYETTGMGVHSVFKQQIPVSNGQFIGTITFNCDYPYGATGTWKSYIVTVVDNNGFAVFSQMTGVPGTGIRPIPYPN